MNILIELPTWLGDAVMATPAIQNIINTHKNAKITILGSMVAIKALSNFDNVIKSIEDSTKKSFFRLFAVWRLSKKVGKYDIAISFRTTIYSKILFWLIESKQTFYMKKDRASHQVLKYNKFINSSLK
jgi:heptosyltransferase-2